MLEVRARTERADYLNAQLAARAEMRALDNQLVIHSNQLALTKQSNSQLADGATAKASELGAAQTALHAKEERLDATQLALGARAEAQSCRRRRRGCARNSPRRSRGSG